MINRRKVRASLGSRSNRKRGTKSKAIPGSQGGKGKMQQYRYATSAKHARPRVALERKIQGDDNGKKQKED